MSQSTPQAFIHYIRRDIRSFKGESLDPLWCSEDQGPASGFEKPVYHVTRAINGPAAEVKPGDTIWIVGQLYSPWGKLPAALDSRIDVTAVTELREDDKHTGYRFTAAASSRWFPLADSTRILQSLETTARGGTPQPLWPATNQSIGSFLQRMRKLTSDEPLRRWEQSRDLCGFEFISYRLRDGTRAAFNQVSKVIDSGGCVFWDRWSLPRRLAERREFVKDKVLQHLNEQISLAKKVWGICSPLYAASDSYSALEMNYAQMLGVFQPVFPDDNQEA